MTVRATCLPAATPARPTVLFPLVAALLAGCSHGDGTLRETLDPDADRQITQQDEVAVEIVALPGIDTGPIDLDRLARTIRGKIDQRKAAVPSPRTRRRFGLSITISRYDGGRAAGAQNAGDTHIDGWRLLTDPDIVARLHRYRDRVADRETFAWSQAYPSPTPIQAVEEDFATAVAAELFAGP